MAIVSNGFELLEIMLMNVFISVRTTMAYGKRIESL